MLLPPELGSTAGGRCGAARLEDQMPSVRDFTEHAAPAEVPAVIGRCHCDLVTPSAAAPTELVERLAGNGADRAERPAPDAA